MGCSVVLPVGPRRRQEEVEWKIYLKVEAWVCELEGRALTNGGSSRKTAAPVCSGQLPRQGRRVDLTSDSMQRNSNSFLQRQCGESYDKYLRGHAFSQVDERENKFMGLFGSGGLPHQTHRSIRIRL